MRHSLPSRGSLLLLGLALCLAAACAPARPEDAALAAAHQLEERLMAPCCWRQPLRDHESELASQLRQEVRERLATGETSASIEADMVKRYGERIRALPGGGGDPRWMIIAACSALAGAGLFALWRMVKRSRSRLPATAAAAGPRAAELVYQERLDDELAAID